jgi:hypothetical protein
VSREGRGAFWTFFFWWPKNKKKKKNILVLFLGKTIPNPPYSPTYTKNIERRMVLYGVMT